MNNCCKVELRKAMQSQRDVAITVGMALVFIEAVWQSQKWVENLSDGPICRHCKEAAVGAVIHHTPDCAFVAVWNGEEMTYLRYSLDIKHEVKVK